MPTKRARQGRSPVRRRPARRMRGGADAASDAPDLSQEDLARALDAASIATAIVRDGAIAHANEAFGRLVGLEASAVRGRTLGELLPPHRGAMPTPRAGAACSYRTRVDGVLARVDLSAADDRRAGPNGLVTAIVLPKMEASDTAAGRALLSLSRELAEARSEDEIAAATARALVVLFPDRSFCIRLLDPRTLALTSLYAHGRLRPHARARFAIRRAAVRRMGLSEDELTAGGILVTEADEPIFEDCDRALAVPLAVGGTLHGILNLEQAPDAPGDPEGDGPLLVQVANHVALGARNLRSVEDLTYLKQYLEDLIEHANALIAVVNRCREVIVWNAAFVELTGLSRDEVLGDDVLELVHADERARLEAALLRSFEGESVSGLELRGMRKQGGEVRIAVNTAPIRGAAGEVDGVIAIGQDLTRLRTLEAAAEHAERLAGIGRLAAGIVHELNNPLTAVTMYSEALLEKLSAAGHDAADLDKLRGVRDAGQRIHRLARDLIAYARPSGLRIEPCDLAALLDEAVRMAKPALKEANASVVRRFEAAPEVEGNRASLVQVFVNLVTNAAQALKEGGGTIALSLEPDGDGVRVTVDDDGTGMPHEIRARLFEPFFTTRPGRGIGLGLPIVHGIVQRHGGSVHVETDVGRGTTVRVVLPRTQGA